MPILAVIIPLLMLAAMLALGRYEELLLPTEADQDEDAATGAVQAAPSLTVDG